MADTTPSHSARTPSGAFSLSTPDQAEPAAADAVAQARDIATGLIGAVRDSAAALLDEQRTRAANEVATLGEVLHRSVQLLDRGALDRRGGGNVARYTDGAARQISQFADRLRRRSLAELAGDVEDFAGRWPIAFIGSAIGAGLIAGRFLASSATRPTGQASAQSGVPHSAGTGEEPPGDFQASRRFRA